MAKRKFLVNLDLNKNQLLNTILQVLASDPTATSSDKGWVYYNSSSKEIRYFNGTEWKNAGSVQSIGADETTPIIVTNENGSVTIGILEASQTQDGYLSKEDKAKLDGIEAGATADQLADEVDLRNTTGMHYPAGGDVESILKAVDSALWGHLDPAATDVHDASQIKVSVDNAFYGDTVQAALEALKAYVAGVKDSSLKAPEPYDPTPGTYPADFEGDAIQKGDSYRMTKTGTLGSRPVNPEDLLIAIADNPGQDDANWMVIEGNRDQATTDFLGLVKLATQAQAEAGTNDTAAMTPLKVKQFYQAQSPVSHFNGNIVGDGSTSNFTVIHNLGIAENTLPMAVFRDADTGEIVEMYYEKSATDSANMIQVSVNAPIADGKVYNVTVYAGK